MTKLIGLKNCKVVYLWSSRQERTLTLTTAIMRLSLDKIAAAIVFQSEVSDVVAPGGIFD